MHTHLKNQGTGLLPPITQLDCNNRPACPTACGGKKALLTFCKDPKTRVCFAFSSPHCCFHSSKATFTKLRGCHSAGGSPSTASGTAAASLGAMATIHLRAAASPARAGVTYVCSFNLAAATQNTPRAIVSPHMQNHGGVGVQYGSEPHPSLPNPSCLHNSCGSRHQTATRTARVIDSSAALAPHTTT
jgi:hypothetical protein